MFDLDIQMTGPLPRAMQADVANGIRNWLMTIAELAEIYPDMLDIPDVDACARAVGRARRG